jgi:hypothetical protein
MYPLEHILPARHKRSWRYRVECGRCRSCSPEAMPSQVFALLRRPLQGVHVYVVAYACKQRGALLTGTRTDATLLVGNQRLSRRAGLNRELLED